MPPVPSPPRRAPDLGAAVTAAMAALFVGATLFAVGLALDWALSASLGLGRPGLVAGGIVAAAAALAGAAITARRAFAAEREMPATAAAAGDEGAGPDG